MINFEVGCLLIFFRCCLNHAYYLLADLRMGIKRTRRRSLDGLMNFRSRSFLVFWVSPDWVSLFPWIGVSTKHLGKSQRP